MAEEHGIFWLGAPPEPQQTPQHLADSDEFVCGIQQACESAGCQVKRFIAAQGVYGTWLVEFSRDATEERVLWNGKEQQLVLQVRSGHGSWDEPKTVPVANQDLEGFAAALEVLLSQDQIPQQQSQQGPPG